jgi:hypothetical protein
MKKFIALLAVIPFLVSACGADAEPTINAADVAATAEAAAWTMVAETQAAIPTNTLVPSTNTPEPTPLLTNTPIPLPTQPPQEQPTSTSNVDRCDQLLQAPEGPVTRLRLINETKAQVNLSITLYETPFGDCGYKGFQLNKGDRVVVEFPIGCYFFYAWVNAQNPSTASGSGCANNTDLWNVNIRPDSINIKPP